MKNYFILYEYISLKLTGNKIPWDNKAVRVDGLVQINEGF